MVAMSGSSHPVQQGDTLLTNMHYSQAVRIGDRVEISGQGGWYDEFGFPADLRDEISQPSTTWSGRWLRQERLGGTSSR
jgi:enamine deaminase RidA (YjgF/YER057c/UK114 family)